MNILWLSDFSIKHRNGGSPRSDKYMLDYGRNLGYNIIEYNHDTNKPLKTDKYDILVSSNIFVLNHKIPQLINIISNHPCHIRYEHDSNAYLNSRDRHKLFNNTKLCIFLSELHQKAFCDKYHLSLSQSQIVYSPINLDVFYDYRQLRENATLWSGDVQQHKGVESFTKEIYNNPKNKFVIAGFGEINYFKQFSNVEILNEIRYEDMPNLYNKYETLYLHPVGVGPLFIEPFCRTVAEAMFCGMKLNVSNNIGSVIATEMLGINQLKKECQNSPKRFWELISETYNN